ncbi:FAD/NAD(P)-binding domain-containing protein [Punctularia strigosozonata HHB-11173 SS5]|uniref:FAD/NAD(P)-binding domain-containing protein n=1 Tax=Punctularia strigosozonata (strain HHB-11173) TaxID=741275 RepID=UPI0004418340|nr:FAD/NAD(P)-binding domain-containing protein [Punctularia strigosozonata HHB-11173 SS5]EIN05675.1 FAD/NAD(P)-binding domain-containing protein [Punctularia strigosozonata HHB-11173 SS5]
MPYFDLDVHAKNPALRIVIVGGGIAGLSCALALARAGFNNVQIFDRARSLDDAEVGAGLQLAPNFTRCLARFGLLEEVRRYAVATSTISLRRYIDNEVTGSAPMMPEIEQKYGSPLWVAHRADLQRTLLSAVRKAGVDIITNAQVTEVAFEDPPKIRIDGRENWVESDVLIAADGVKSVVRKQLLALHGTEDRAHATGDAAYRITIPREKLLPHPDLLAMLDSSTAYRWMGPSGHIMAYAIRAHEVFNMVLAHPDKNDAVESWTSKGSKEEMMETYKDWNSVVKRLLDFVEPDKVLEWKLMDHLPLPTWIEGNVALMGDACHPMLPYVAQGAAQAVEDAAVLAAVLSGVKFPARPTSHENANARLSTTRQIRNALALYQSVRKDRAERIQASAAKTRVALHLPDGPKQVERDEAIRNAAQGGRNPDQWADAEWQAYMYGVDTTREALNRLSEVTGSVKTMDGETGPAGLVY